MGLLYVLIRGMYHRIILILQQFQCDGEKCTRKWVHMLHFGDSLETAIRLLKLSSIQHRLEGVELVVYHCRRAHRDKKRDKASMISEYLMQWIDEYRVVDLLFEEDSHPEIIEKIKTILQFICKESQLTYDHLGIIWSSLERADAKVIEEGNEQQILQHANQGMDVEPSRYGGIVHAGYLNKRTHHNTWTKVHHFLRVLPPPDSLFEMNLIIRDTQCSGKIWH